MAGCGSTREATEAVRGKWLGKPADAFFAQNGPPKRSHALTSGGKVFHWETVAMPSGTRIQITCTADLVTDSRGTITDIKLLEDTIGHWNMSRCSEIFQ